MIGSTRISTTTDGALFLDPDEAQKRRALRKEMRRKRREIMLQGTSMLENDEDVRKEEDMENSPLHSVITTSNIQTEEKILSSSLTSLNKKYNKKSCQIDTNEKMSLEEQEARKSLLNIHSSQVGYNLCIR